MNTSAVFSKVCHHGAACLLASTAMAWLYADGGVGWVLGFVFLVPWLCTLNKTKTLTATLLHAWAMSVAFSLAAFAWFGAAIGNYTQLGTATGLLILLVAAPLFQPQFFLFAVVRYLVRHKHGPVLGALAGAAAWVATEWCVPKLLGDTLGYGLYPSRLMRQAADVGGTAGLTVLLLLVNEALTLALSRRTQSIRTIATPLVWAALVPALLTAYGWYVLSALPGTAGTPLRMGMIQSNIVDYERLRQEKGADTVVREVLDTHFAMSYDAIERQQAHAMLWSETVYPTTFGHPKNEVGAEFDRAILDTITAAGVPFVFGTFDTDATHEYNAAAFVAPHTGLQGFYRKARPFLLSEYVPAWLDGPLLRQWLPWAGAWQAGNGARVFPLKLADGREIPVLPLICLDDVDTDLAIDGTRLGAQAILSMSNDSWFTQHAQGANMHQTAAAFRSIETRLPQFRVTTNSLSAVIDTTGTVVAGTRRGERALLVGALPVQEPVPTLMVLWGDWVGRVALWFLGLMVVAHAMRRWSLPAPQHTLEHTPEAAALQTLPANVVVLPLAARIVAGTLRVFARGSLPVFAIVIVLSTGALHSNTLAQIRSFVALFVVPELAAWLVLRAFAARATVEQGLLVLTQGARRLKLPLHDVAAVEPLRLPFPGFGVSLKLHSGAYWTYTLMHPQPLALQHALCPRPEQASSSTQPVRAAWAVLYAQVCQALPRVRLGHPLLKFGVLPLLLALPAFRLHQHIAYGGTLGEYHAFGLTAYMKAFGLWWAAWFIAVVLCAALLRTVVETGTLVSVLVRPARTRDTRFYLERLSLAVLYLGMPAWLAMRVYGS